jgi:hypothetical protein
VRWSETASEAQATSQGHTVKHAAPVDTVDETPVTPPGQFQWDAFQPDWGNSQRPGLAWLQNQPLRFFSGGAVHSLDLANTGLKKRIDAETWRLPAVSAIEQFRLLRSSGLKSLQDFL